MTSSATSRGGSKSRCGSAFDSPTFNLDMSIKVDAAVGSMSISPSSRDVVLASRQGLHIVDLDNPYDPPRFLQHLTAWSVADVQWSPHASHAHWVVSTSNQKAVVWNLALPSTKAIEHVLHSHTRAITDINFSAHEPSMLATCSIDSFVHCWDLRTPRRPAMSFCDWFAGATQVKWNRQNKHILASSHDKYLYIWDSRMGAQAVRRINAHSTKIYGVDWNRTRPSGIITCALDKTVKFWDYERTVEDTPERVIHTSFPVWRARHTPFGWGVLTMPQRGDTSLYLWDRRAKGDAPTEPVAKFTGHTDYVKEFLWRWRGGQGEDGGDDREFQLVSWGLDRDIRLWSVDRDMMTKIGHDPNKMRFRVTRVGAKYMTFRDEAEIAREYGPSQKPASQMPLLNSGAGLPSEDDSEASKIPRKDSLLPTHLRNGGIGQQLSFIQNGGLASPDDRRLQKALTGTREGGFMRAGSMRRKEINPIAWMKGVRVGRKASDGSGLENSRSSHRGGVGGEFGLSWEAPENLGDEISLVGSKFPKINFEKVNIAARTCTVSLTGPWGVNDKWVFLRVEVVFPSEYPCDGAIPLFTLEKTNSIPEENLQIADSQLERIANAHVSKRKVCLEACLCYLLGERAEDAAMVGSDDDDDSSSDGDEGMVNLGVRNAEEEEGTASLVQHANQASVPLPKACGAMWSHDGRLVCFFPPKEERNNKGLLSSLAVREGERGFRVGGGGRLWEGFGRLQVQSPVSRRRNLNDTEQESSDSSYTTSDESSDESDSGIHDEPLRPSLGWRLHGNSSLGRGFRRGGSTDRSTQRSTGTGVKTTSSDTKGKNVVSIHDMSHILPAKKELAVQYKIHGRGSIVCRHNAEVADGVGYPDLADVWRLVEMILCNDVPLQVYQSSKVEDGDDDELGDSVLVMARRANLERGRRDSGLGMGLDDDEDVLPDYLGRVKWGAHPLGGVWLVGQLFAYFEKKADVQMLAMLSCLLCLTTNSVDHDEETTDLSMPSNPPSDRDYLSSIDMMLDSHHSTLSISPSHHSASMTPIGTHGSYGSSAGGHFNSDPVMPFSTGTTPPSSNLRFNADEYGSRSLSSSPEQHHHHVRRSTSGMAANFAGNFARAFAPGHSPPTRKRPSPAESILNPLTSGVTWGAITTFGSGSKGASSTITEATSEANGSHDPIHISLFNREMFDDEAVGTIPLLDPALAPTYKAYRDTYANLLHCWELPLRRLEVLKFNSFDHSQEPSSPILGEFTRGRRSIGWDGLQIAGYCSKCGSVLDVTNGAKGECKSCKRRQVTMTCVVCDVIIKGLYGPCLKCGHIAHAECHRAWFATGGDGCPTGCGCECLQDEAAFDDGAVTPIVREPPFKSLDIENWAL